MARRYTCYLPTYSNQATNPYGWYAVPALLGLPELPANFVNLDPDGGVRVPFLLSEDQWQDKLRYELNGLLALPMADGIYPRGSRYNVSTGQDTDLGALVLGSLWRNVQAREVAAGLDPDQTFTGDVDYEAHARAPLDPHAPLVSQTLHFAAWALHADRLRVTLRAGDGSVPEHLRFTNAATMHDRYFQRATEQVAFYAHALRTRGVKLAGLLSYLMAWQVVYGSVLHDMRVSLGSDATQLGKPANAGALRRVTDLLEAQRYQRGLLAKAVTQRVVTRDPRWDRTVQNLGTGYIEMLKGLLYGLEDTLETLGQPYTVAVRLRGLLIEDARATDYSPQLSEYAGEFMRAVQDCMAEMERGTFRPAWLREHDCAAALKAAV